MSWRDIQQVCLNGHQITDRYKDSPLTRKSFCSKCGAKTIVECQNCGEKIPGKIHYENVVDLSGYTEPVPDICQYCGQKYPWSEKRLIDRNPEVRRRMKKISLKKIGAFMVVIIGVLTSLTGMFVSVFELWDRVKEPITSIEKPIITISLSPIRINYSENVNNDGTIHSTAKVETGKGLFKFVDSVTVTNFQIIDSTYFVLDVSLPSIRLTKATFEKMILGEGMKEQDIQLDFFKNYILTGQKVMELYNLKADHLIARASVSFPFYFNEQKHYYSADLRVYGYYK